jgi:hypothetical protein
MIQDGQTRTKLMLRVNQLTGFGGGKSIYKIKQSVLFNSVSYYLYRTATIPAGDRRNWTFSFWARRTAFTGVPNTILSYEFSNAWRDRIMMGNGGANRFAYFGKHNSVSVSQIYTPAIVNDIWYHWVVAADTNNATASERLRFYKDGVQVATTTTDRLLNQSENTEINSNVPYVMIGNRWNSNGGTITDPALSYLAEMIFVDGQTLDANQFGRTRGGVWVPERYNGTYGTMGYHLDFANSGNLGLDISGNGNNWISTVPVGNVSTSIVPPS